QRRLDDRPAQGLALHARGGGWTVVPRNTGAGGRPPQSGISAGDRPSVIPVSSRTSSLSAGDPASCAAVVRACGPAGGVAWPGVPGVPVAWRGVLRGAGPDGAAPSLRLIPGKGIG